MATPTENAVFDGYRLMTLRQSLCSLRDQVKTLNASEHTQQKLEESVGILSIWLATHFEGHMNPESVAPDIWGIQAWEKMQNQLSELSDKIGSIQVMLYSMPKAEERSLKTMFRPEKSKQSAEDVSVLLPLVAELHESLKMLVTCSEIRVRMNHPEASLIRPALEDAVQARRGAYILYDAIQAKGIRCNLNIDLFSDHPDSITRSQGPPLYSEFHRSICYHLIFKGTDRNDKCFEDVNYRTDMYNSKNLMTHKNAIPLLEPSHANPVEPICIQRGEFDRKTYFGVYNCDNCSFVGQPWSDYLEKCPFAMGERDYKHLKILFASQLSECALYLIGTPFLARLAMEDISANVYGTHAIFTLALPTLNTEQLCGTSPHSMTESRQLLQLGMVLIENALGRLDRYETASRPRDMYGFSAKLLPHVRQKMGNTYYNICAFCVEEQTDVYPYRRPDKWEGAEESGWNVRLRDFLRVYDSVVVEGLRKLLQSNTP